MIGLRFTFRLGGTQLDSESGIDMNWERWHHYHVIAQPTQTPHQKLAHRTSPQLLTYHSARRGCLYPAFRSSTLPSKAAQPFARWVRARYSLGGSHTGTLGAKSLCTQRARWIRAVLKTDLGNRPLVTACSAQVRAAAWKASCHAPLCRLFSILPTDLGAAGNGGLEISRPGGGPFF